MAAKKYSLLDQFIIAADNAVRTVCAPAIAARPTPATDQAEQPLRKEEQKKSSSLMRINHTGEVCAQALYYGQAMATSSNQLKKTLLEAAEEENDHLAWCEQRLTELNSHTSYLNPLWYIGSFSLGLVCGAISDRWSLGFVVETERQVERHLKKHLAELPKDDQKSKAVLEKMCEEEAHHATVALGAGAIELPSVVKNIMAMMSKVMTKTTYYI